MDAFDRFWRWAEKPLDSSLTIPAGIHHAVMSLPPTERRDRAKVNEAVRKLMETSDKNTTQHRP
jgi:hypothetical protein